ncbi:MAG: ferredoxin--NADP reductase, partial [Bacteroidota bacterium]
QYHTLKVDVNGESLRSAYSLCYSPYTDADLAVTVKRVDGGRVSNHLPDTLKVGDTVEVMPPMGNFALDVNAGLAEHFILIGGGSGITPLMSILKSVLSQAPQSKVSLLYANRDADSIIFKAELEQLQAQHGERFRIVHSLDNPPAGWSGMSGQLSKSSMFPLFQDLISQGGQKKSFWLCGPQGLMDEAKSALQFVGFDTKDIHQELFSAKLPEPGTAKPAADPARGTYTVTVVLDDETKEVVVDESSTILDAVINDGMDPPYACQMGVCCTCRAKLISGKVEMEEDEGLSDSELDEGFILTCQAHPLTADCKLEFM